MGSLFIFKGYHTMTQVEWREISRYHQVVYDGLAEQYEGRVEALRPLSLAGCNSLKSYLPGKRILDIGCGVGLTIENLITFGLSPVGIDVSPRMLDYARQRCPADSVILGDFLDWKFNELFDGVIAFAFIHLFPKTIALQCLAKIRDVLRPAGAAFINTTLSDVSVEGFVPKIDYIGSPVRFRKFWTREEFAEALDQSGFRIVEIEIVDDPFGKRWMDAVVTRPG
jgi:SAM-dependent methyltransferase